MCLTITGFISLTVQVSLASGCPPGLIPCGATGCCDPNGPLFHQFCADPSRDLCCLSNEHASNGKCCRPNQENCQGKCCGGVCRTVRGRHVCVYQTDQQCKNIGGQGLCAPNGICHDLGYVCDGQCCIPAPPT